MNLPDLPDLQRDLLTTAEAAQLAGVSVDVIRQWKTRGHLPAAGNDQRGRPLYRGIDVLHAEAATRKAARRHPVPLAG
jgi:DNA-binding transcriptional MerR regulator